MNNLSEIDVAEEEKPFETTLTLDGEFDVIMGDALRVDKRNGKTLVTLTTMKARNYTLQLKKQ